MTDFFSSKNILSHYFFIENKLVLHLRLDNMLQYFIIITNKTWILLKLINLKLIAYATL